MSCGRDKIIKIWNYETFEFVKNLSGHTESITSLIHIENTQFIISGSRDETIKIWNYETG